MRLEVLALTGLALDGTGGCAGPDTARLDCCFMLLTHGGCMIRAGPSLGLLDIEEESLSPDDPRELMGLGALRLLAGCRAGGASLSSTGSFVFRSLTRADSGWGSPASSHSLQSSQNDQTYSLGPITSKWISQLTEAEARWKRPNPGH